MNIEHINLVIDAIEAAEPEQVIMGNLTVELDSKAERSQICDTAACIAGWTLFAKYKTFDGWEFNAEDETICLASDEILDRLRSDGDCMNAAQIILDIETTESEQLFKMHYDFEEYESYIIELKELLNIPHDRPYHSSDYHPWQNILNYFDDLPSEVRKRAAINVLIQLRDIKVVDWIKAIKAALASFTCERNTTT